MVRVTGSFFSVASYVGFCFLVSLEGHGLEFGFAGRS